MISKALFISNIFLLISIWTFTGLKYGDLPEIIPTHFNVQGVADGYGHKKMIWILPSIATFISLILIGVTRNPNSPMLHVPDNFRNKKSIELFSYSILFPLLLVLGAIVLETVWIAEGKIHSLSYMFFVFLGLFFAVLITNLFVMIKKR